MLDARLTRNPALLGTALDRVAEFAESHGVVFVMCPQDAQLDAIELARRIGLAKVVIYTDSEPSVRQASHLEVLELADQRAVPVSDGAARAASLHDVSYETRCVTDNRSMVVRSDSFEDRSSPIISIVASSGYALVTLRAKTQGAAPWEALRMRVLGKIAGAGISIEMLQWFSTGVRFLVPTDRLASLQGLTRELDLGFHAVDDCARLYIVGTGVRSTAGVFHRSLACLTERNVPLLHCADSNVTLSFVVNDRYADEAHAALREALVPGHSVSGGLPLTLDADLGLARLNGRDVRLGARQAQLLRHLLANVGRVVDVEELARVLFGSEEDKRIAAVRVHLHNLRKKIEHDPENPRYIVTVPEQGYVFLR